jgi:transposase
LLTNRREDLVRTRTQTVNRLHRLLVDLVPAGADRNLTADRAAALLGQVTPTGTPAAIRWQLASDLVADVRDPDERIAVVEARITAAVAQAKTRLVELFGVGPVLAAKLLGRSVTCAGSRPSTTSPPTPELHHSRLPAGQVVRHRLSRAGDPKLNHALYLMAIVQVRHPTAGRPTTGASTSRASPPRRPCAA